MTFVIQIAESIAFEVHGNQFRRDGKTPYLNHVEDVVRRVRADGLGGAAVAIAWLHDVLEDSKPRWHGIDLQNRGMPAHVVTGVQWLTREPSEPYELFITRLRYGAPDMVRRIKVHDILSNLADDPTDKQVYKYSRALVQLTYDY